MGSSGEKMSILARWNQSGEPFRLNQLCNLREGMREWGCTSSHFGTSFLDETSRRKCLRRRPDFFYSSFFPSYTIFVTLLSFLLSVPLLLFFSLWIEWLVLNTRRKLTSSSCAWPFHLSLPFISISFSLSKHLPKGTANPCPIAAPSFIHI